MRSDERDRGDLGGRAASLQNKVKPPSGRRPWNPTFRKAGHPLRCRLRRMHRSFASLRMTAFTHVANLRDTTPVSAAQTLTSAAKAYLKTRQFIAALKRCAAQNQVSHRVVPQRCCRASLGWADECVRPYVICGGLAGLVGAADYQDHSWAEGCDVAVVVLQGGDGG